MSRGEKTTRRRPKTRASSRETTPLRANERPAGSYIDACSLSLFISLHRNDSTSPAGRTRTRVFSARAFLFPSPPRSRPSLTTLETRRRARLRREHLVLALPPRPEVPPPPLVPATRANPRRTRRRREKPRRVPTRRSRRTSRSRGRFRRRRRRRRRRARTRRKRRKRRKRRDRKRRRRRRRRRNFGGDDGDSARRLVPGRVAAVHPGIHREPARSRRRRERPRECIPELIDERRQPRVAETQRRVEQTDSFAARVPRPRRRERRERDPIAPLFRERHQRLGSTHQRAERVEIETGIGIGRRRGTVRGGTRVGGRRRRGRRRRGREPGT